MSISRTTCPTRSAACASHSRRTSRCERASRSSSKKSQQIICCKTRNEVGSVACGPPCGGPFAFWPTLATRPPTFTGPLQNQESASARDEHKAILFNALTRLYEANAVKVGKRMSLSPLRLQIGRPQRGVGGVAQSHRHHAGIGLDRHMAEELIAGGGAEILVGGTGIGRFRELHLGAESHVEIIGAERAGMDRAGDELPEWVEVLELRLVGIVVMRGGVVHVGGQPDRVVHAGRL